MPSRRQAIIWTNVDGDKPLPEPMMVSLPTHICVTRPQWVLMAWFSNPPRYYIWLDVSARLSVFGCPETFTETIDIFHCPACRTYEIATRFWDVVGDLYPGICPIHMCLTVYEFSFTLFDLCLFITIFSFILNYVLIVTFWIFTYYKFWIMLIIYRFIWNYWIIYFVTCLEVFWGCMS